MLTGGQTETKTDCQGKIYHETQSKLNWENIYGRNVIKNVVEN
jgi:hypothetical protein